MADSNDATMPGNRESTPVQLTRMEGKLDLISFRMDDVVARVERHDTEIAALTVTTQRLDSDAKAAAATALALAQALREADDMRSRKVAETWTPFQRFLAALAGVTAVAALVLAAIR